MNFFKHKKILITGGTGSIGSALVRRLLKLDCDVIRIFSRDDTKQAQLRDELGEYSHLRYLIGDVRDYERLEMAMKDIDIVFHCAALKHVPACEYNPFEAVKTNIIGTQNVISAAAKQGLKNDVKVVAISTDKAVNPINSLGVTKLMAEKLITAANNYIAGTVFCAVRFGNIIGSRGSVLEVIKRQIENNKPITITEPQMTRFFITIDTAVDTILQAAESGEAGDIFVPRMRAAYLRDIIEAAIDIYGNGKKDYQTQIIGAREGEKLHEECMTEEEASRSKLCNNNFVIKKYGEEGIEVYDSNASSANAPKMLIDELLSIMGKKDEAMVFPREAYIA